MMAVKRNGKELPWQLREIDKKFHHSLEKWERSISSLGGMKLANLKKWEQ